MFLYVSGNSSSGSVEANAVWKSSGRLFKEIGDRLARAEERGVFDSQEEEVEEEGSKREESVMATCPHCAQKGHEGEVCQLRFEAVHRRKKPYQETRRQKRLINEAAAGGEPSSSKNVEGDTSKTSMIYVEDQTAVHTPVWINGVKFPRCLIDTGAEVKLISIKDAIE